MAFINRPVLTSFVFISLSFVKVSGFAAFKPGKGVSDAAFQKHARRNEAFIPDEFGHLVWKNQPSRNPPTSLHHPELKFLSNSDRNHHDAGKFLLQPMFAPVVGGDAWYSPPAERLHGLNPTVDCDGELMKLTLHGKEAITGSSFLIDRGHFSPLPLSQLPSECGHQLLRTWRDFVFIIPYNGCYVSQEREAFFLPLIVWGFPVKLSCFSPTPVQNLPTVSCYTNGMIARLPRERTENLKVKVMSRWEPLLKSCGTCGYKVVSHSEGIILHAPYTPCAEKQDGIFAVSLRGVEAFNLSCPSPGLPVSQSDSASKNSVGPYNSVASTSPSPVAKTKNIQHKQTSAIYKTTVTPKVSPLLSNPPKIHVNPKPCGRKPSPIRYPWFPKPNLAFHPGSMYDSYASYPRKPLSPTKPSKNHHVYLLKPSSPTPQKNMYPATPKPSNLRRMPFLPPGKLNHLFYPDKMIMPSGFLSQTPQWPSQTQLQARPEITSNPKLTKPHTLLKPVTSPPRPDPTVKEANIPDYRWRFPWSKPLKPIRLEMPFVPSEAPPNTTVFATLTQFVKNQAHVNHSKITFTKLSYFIPKSEPVSTSTNVSDVACTVFQSKVLNTPVRLCHELCVHCPSCCPSISYHYHNHHHFFHPLPLSDHEAFNQTRMPSSPVMSVLSTLFPSSQYTSPPHEGAAAYVSKQAKIQHLAATGNSIKQPNQSFNLAKRLRHPVRFETQKLPSFPESLLQPVDFERGQHVVPFQDSKLFSRHSQTKPVSGKLVFSQQELKPHGSQAALQRPVPQPDHGAQPVLVAPVNVKPYLNIIGRSVTTMPPALRENLIKNNWYQGTGRSTMSDTSLKSRFSHDALPYSLSDSRLFGVANKPLKPEASTYALIPHRLPSLQAHNYVPQKFGRHFFYNPESPEYRSLLFDTYSVPAVPSIKKTSLSNVYGSISGPPALEHDSQNEIQSK